MKPPYQLAFAITLVFIIAIAQKTYANENLLSKKNPFAEKILSQLEIKDLKTQQKAAKSILHTGLSDERVFQKLAELINHNIDIEDYRLISWLAIGLGSSGNEQYRPLLEKLLSKSKGKANRHFLRALKELDERQKLNSAISALNYQGSSNLREKNDYIRYLLSRLYVDEEAYLYNIHRFLKDKGIQEKLVYDKISQLTQLFSTDSDSENDKYLNSLIVGLSYSGNLDYLPILENLPEDLSSKTKKYIKEAKKRIVDQTILNPIYANEDLYSGEETWESLRNANFVYASTEFKTIHRMADNFIAYQKFDPLVFDVMNARILSDFENVFENKAKVDAYSVWTKAFAFSPSSSYLDTIEKVSTSAGNEKLRRYASKVLKRSGIRISEIKDIIKNLEYNGEPIGTVTVEFLDSENIEPEKVSSFEKMSLQAEILQRLQLSNKFQEASSNSLSIKINSYRVRSKAAKAFFGAQLMGADSMQADIELQLQGKQIQKFEIRSVVAPRVFENQYASGEIKLRNDFLIKLMSIFKD